MVVPQARRPGLNVFVPVPAVAALQVVPEVAISLTTTAVGTPGVKVLLIRSLRTDREASPLGVTGQAQHEINCSSGENVYTFTQMLPFCVGNDVVELAPVLVMLMTESPIARFEA